MEIWYPAKLQTLCSSSLPLQLLNLGDSRLTGTLGTQIGQLLTKLWALHTSASKKFSGKCSNRNRSLVLSFLTHSRIGGNEFSGPLPNENGRLALHCTPDRFPVKYLNNLFTVSKKTRKYKYVPFVFTTFKRSSFPLLNDRSQLIPCFNYYYYYSGHYS